MLALVAASSARAQPPSWRRLGAGVDYAAVAIAPKPAIGEGVLHVVRIDPALARIQPRIAKQLGGEARTAGAWCDNPRVAAVINAGMYNEDMVTHTGYLRVGERVHNRHWAKKYQSIFLLGPRRKGLPAATIRDAGPDGKAADHADYDTVIQNLRLIRDPGVNVWSASGRRWAEAAIALDRDGHILFLFSRSPFIMRDFNALLLRLPLGIVRAMHVEGGPEASLSVRGPGVALDLAGSFETGFYDSDGNAAQWPLPNVLAVEVSSR